MNMKSYRSRKAAREQIQFELDDRVFAFQPPKVAPLLLAFASGDAGSVAALFDWLSDGLSEDDNAFIISRLQDPHDDLDFDVLNEIIEDLFASTAKRPTKP